MIGLASDRLRLHARTRLLGAAFVLASAMLALVPLARSLMPGVLVLSLAVLMAAHGALIKRWRMR